MIAAKSYWFVFAQKGWFGKVLVGALLTSVPVVQATAIGYQMKVMSRLLSGHEDSMPEWENAFDLWVQGMKIWLANKLLYAPVAIAFALTWSVTSGALYGAYLRFEAEGIKDALDFAWGLKTAAPLIFGLPASMAAVYAVARLVVPAMTLRVAETRSFFSALNPVGVLGFIFKHLGAYVMTTALLFVLFLVMSTIIIPASAPFIAVLGLGALFGWFALSVVRFYIRLVWAHALIAMRKGSQDISLT
jgi:hypothetical protein